MKTRSSPMKTDYRPGQEKARLVVAIDCAKEYPPEQYFGHGEVKVRETAVGTYREAEAKPLSRFGYRFQIEHIGKPHVARIRYPDDRRRYMCIMDGTTYDMTTGVFTDFAQPVSNKMEEIRLVFWPRWNDCSIVFMTWGIGEPAAVSSIEIHELEELPALPAPALKAGKRSGGFAGGARREIGVQYEDPCGVCMSEGAMTQEEWVDRITAYLRHSGQNMLVYPICWYHGPILPMRREPSSAGESVAARDRKLYARWTTKPVDWLTGMLERFGREGLGFKASATLMRLGSLMEKMNIDLESIKRGGDTINNMLCNDNVQAGTQDWTPIYNVRNYAPYIEAQEKGQDMKEFRLAYGEKTGQPYPPGPIFNPLHPIVQDAIVGFAKEIAERYGRFKAFKGISFNLWPPAIVWFGSIRSGYDDYTVGLFEKETGIKVPVDPLAPDRFSKRYEILVHDCRSAWVSWRCEKIHQLFGKVRDAVRAGRPDLLVTVTFWNEMFIGAGASRQLCAKSATRELCREAGFDLELYGDEPGIQIDYQLAPSRDRAGGATLTDGVNRPAEYVAMHRDHDFLDQETLDLFHGLPRRGAFIFDSWVEAWGEHKWFSCEPGDAQAAELSFMSGKPVEGIFRMNSTYPKDGFWWDSQLRITPAHPGGIHYLEHFAHAIAELDACAITRGGLFLDTAHADQVAGFARAFQALPREPFETVGQSTDPVAVRTLVAEGRRYFYLVNRDYYEIAVELDLNKPTAKIMDLATGETLPASKRWKLRLGPYELRSFSAASTVKIMGFTATPPRAVAARLVADAEEAVRLIDRTRAGGNEIPGAQRIASGIRAALEERRYAWLRRALMSYVVLRCRELSAGAPVAGAAGQ